MKPSAFELWHQAFSEWPADRLRAQARYRELMIEHGHLVPADSGLDNNLPCGWPGRVVESAGDPDAT